MLTVTALPAFEDNYIWVLHANGHAVAVDPGDPAPLVAFIDAQNLALGAVLITHHHRDHSGGNRLLLERYGCPIYGPDNPRIPALTQHVHARDTLAFTALALELTVLETPGHTLDHVSYYGANHLFCGDTLFGCGCGKLFEGTPAIMAHSLDQILALPDATRVCCAHEYTLSNIAFALTIDRDNPRLLARERSDRARRTRDEPTLPSQLGDEKCTNPFLRFHDPDLRRFAEIRLGRSDGSAAEVFGAIRAAKDEWDRG
jgi:hydroxyacylglutathione hydrolase